jgi:hypothetical protein
MSRLPAPAALAAAGLAVAACSTAQPAPQRLARVVMRSGDPPYRVIERIRSDAVARGWRVIDESPDSVAVDFGTQEMRVPVPTEFGLWGSRVMLRDTEVHGSALYTVAEGPNGTVITMWNNPIYYHPDVLCWLPGPYDVAPGAEFLRQVAANP